MAITPVNTSVLNEAATSRPGNGTPGAQPPLKAASSSAATQLSDDGRLRAALDKLQSTASALSGREAFAAPVASSSTPQVASASVRGAVSASSHQLEVKQLAQSQSVALGAQVSPNTPIGAGGVSAVQFDFGTVGNGNLQIDASRSATVAVDSRNNSLNGIAQTINSADVGVLAEVVKANGQYQLQLTAEDSGAANAFAVAVKGDASLRAQLQFNPADSSQASLRVSDAQDAQFKLNGVAASASSNIVRDAAPGLVFELKQVGRTGIAVEAQSADRLAQRVGEFVDAVNAVQSQLQQVSGRLPTPAFEEIRVNLNAALNQAERLANVGIRGGGDTAYQLDTIAFQSAMAVNREGVASIFTRPEGTGIADQLAAAALNLSATTANEVSRLSAAARDAQYLRLGPTAETVYGAGLDTQFDQLGGLMQALNESDFTLSAQLALAEAGRGGSTAQIKRLNGLANLLTPSN